MNILIGGNSPTQGFTERAKQAAAVFGPRVMLWQSSAEPANTAAIGSDNCVHILRCPNWFEGDSGASYATQIYGFAKPWVDAIPGIILQLGNEPDIEAGHKGERIGEMAWAVHSVLPNARIGNPPLSVESSVWMSSTNCDVVLVHSYFERQFPDSITNNLFGRSYLHGLRQAAGRPVFVTEFNVVQTNCPIDWSDRNAQAAKWLDMAEKEGVSGACFFILDGQGEWASFDIGPEAAAEILSLRVANQPIPTPPPEDTMGYTRDTVPMRTNAGFARQAWWNHLHLYNPSDVDAIIDAFAQDAPVALPGGDVNVWIAQFCVETGNATSSHWKNSRNAAGVGIYSDGTPSVQWGSVRQGIRGQLELLADYFGDARDPWGVLRSHGFGFDQPLGKVFLRQLDGVWAADPNYSLAIANLANTVLGGVVPTPDPTPEPPPDPTPQPPPTPPVPNISVITGEMVATHAEDYLGNTSFVDEGSTVGSLERCEEYVEVVHEDLGVPRHRWYNAVQHGQSLIDAGLLTKDYTQFRRGMVGFWDGTFFAPDGHTSIYRGDATFIGAGGEAIAVSPDTWIRHPGFMGMCYYPGVGDAAHVEGGIPMGDGFSDSEILRLWFGNKSAAQKRDKKFAFRQGFGIENTYVAAANGLWEGAPGRSIVLGEVMSDEEFDPGTPGRSVRYFQNGKITALKQADGMYLFRIN